MALDPDRIAAALCWLGVLAFAVAAAHHSYRIWKDER